MANRYGIDSAKVLRSINENQQAFDQRKRLARQDEMRESEFAQSNILGEQRIEAGRGQAKINAYKLKSAERAEANRPGLEKQAAEKESRINALKERVGKGDQEAMRMYSALDPEGAKKTYDIISSMDKGQREQAKEAINAQAATLYNIMEIQDPVERNIRYQETRAQLSPEDQATTPENFNESWSEQFLMKTELQGRLLDKVDEKRKDRTKANAATLSGKDKVYKVTDSQEKALDSMAKRFTREKKNALGMGMGVGITEAAMEAKMRSRAVDILQESGGKLSLSRAFNEAAQEMFPDEDILPKDASRSSVGDRIPTKTATNPTTGARMGFFNGKWEAM